MDENARYFSSGLGEGSWVALNNPGQNKMPFPPTRARERDHYSSLQSPQGNSPPSAHCQPKEWRGQVTPIQRRNSSPSSLWPCWSLQSLYFLSFYESPFLYFFLLLMPSFWSPLQTLALLWIPLTGVPPVFCSWLSLFCLCTKAWAKSSIPMLPATSYKLSLTWILQPELPPELHEVFICLYVSICMPQAQSQIYYLPTQTVPACIFTVFINGNNQPDHRPGSHGTAPLPLHPNNHTHTYHLVGQEVFITSLHCPV